MSDDKVLVPRELLEQALSGERLKPRLDKCSCCIGCGNWMPYGRQEAHEHEDSCQEERVAGEAHWSTQVLDILAQPSDGAITNEGAEPVAWQVQAICSDGTRMGWREVSKDRFQEASASAALSASAGGHVDWECRELFSRQVFPASLAPKVCTCPSGDGSLRWPCPVHPPEVKGLVLPERKIAADYWNAYEQPFPADAAGIWNACLDRVKELNS